MRALVAACLLAASVCTFSHSYGAERTYADRLDAGETLRFPQTYDRDGGHFVGGVSYAYVPGTSTRMEDLCDDVDAWKVILPRTKDAHLIGRRGDEMYVELVQGNAILEATYTLHIHLDRAGGEARFWMVRGRRHDIENAWGFFRFDAVPGEYPRTRVTFGVLVDLGAGFLSGMVEPKVQNAVLSVPDRLREYVLRQASR